MTVAATAPLEHAHYGSWRVAWCCLVALAVPATSHAEESPAERARAVLEKQLAWVGDSKAFLGTLEPDALILGNGSFTLASGANAAAIIATLGASARTKEPVRGARLTRIDAGGIENVAWISADVAIVRSKLEPRPISVGRFSVDANARIDRSERNRAARDPSVTGEIVGKRSHAHRASDDVITARIVELIVMDGSTSKVVALSFASSAGAKATGDVLGGPGSAGPLARLLASPYELHGARWDDTATMILGFGSIGVGPEAVRRILEKWRYRDAKVSGSIEVAGTGWRVCAGDVLVAGDSRTWWDKPVRIQVMLIGIPEGRGWKLVAAHAMDGATVSSPLELQP